MEEHVSKVFKGETDFSSKKETDNCDLSHPVSFLDEMNYFIYDIKLHYRFIRKNIRNFINSKKDKNFTKVVYLTAECPLYVSKAGRLDSPLGFISEMRKQSPYTNICLMVPILGLSEDTKISGKITIDIDDNFYTIVKTSVKFDFFVQNKSWDCIIYKFPKNESNVQVYGIYSPAFSYLKNPDDLKVFENAVLFMRAARTAVKNLHKDGFKPDIVHSEFLPFFTGAEFEPKFPPNIKVFQVFDNFASYKEIKQEPFRTLILLADKEGIKRICKDSYMQNCFARLFNVPVKAIEPKMSSYISMICDNYNLFYNSESDEYENKGILIFRHLNDRTKKLFPNLIKKGDEYYYPLSGTIMKSNYWAVYSETYYKDLYEKKLAPPGVMRAIMLTSDKSGFVLPAVCMDNNMGRYKGFDTKNYREERAENKKKLISEFSFNSLKTDFIDKTIFKNPDTASVYGYLDSFYEAPLLFANPNREVYTEGVDILLSTVLKLFERNRNMQIIISIKDGLKDKYVKSVIDFLDENKIFMGRWVYIDGDVNLPRILSSSDIYLYPARLSDKSIKHLLSCHYGCVPVVSDAGILNDTITDIFDNMLNGNGFKTKQSLLYEDENTNIYVNCLEKALELYNSNHSSWNIIVKNCLMTDIHWDFDKLEKYNQIYQNIL